MVAERGLHIDIEVTADPDRVSRADAIVLPGVGAFHDCLAGVMAVDGLRGALETAVVRRARPFLGICVGMQLMATIGVEHGRHPGFDWIGGEVRLIQPTDPKAKIPHMGWNELMIDRPHPVLGGIVTGDHAYFVHSYALRANAEQDVLAHADYAGPIAAIVGRETMIGTQFHPEKSQRTGLTLIGNFLEWRP